MIVADDGSCVVDDKILYKVRIKNRKVDLITSSKKPIHESDVVGKVLYCTSPEYPTFVLIMPKSRVIFGLDELSPKEIAYIIDNPTLCDEITSFNMLKALVKL